MTETLVRVMVLEDHYATGTARADVSPELLAWHESAFAAAGFPVAKEGDDGLHVVEAWLCSRETFRERFLEDDDTRGVTQFTNRIDDIFGDGTNYAKRLRFLVVVSADEIVRRLVNACDPDDGVTPEDFAACERDQALTAFHEMAHIVMFMRNAPGLSPDELKKQWREGLFPHDLKHVSASFGVGSIPDADGVERRPVTEYEASDMIEDWCDRQGEAWLLASEPGFYAACGLGYDEVLSALEKTRRLEGDTYAP